MTNIRIVIADDHPVVRDGLRQVLAGEAGLEVVATADNGADALEKARQYRPDVVVLDLSMPGMNGVEATRVITGEFPATRVVAFSMHDKEAYVHRILDAGATGYVLKGAPVSEVIRAVREVSRGEYFLCAKLQAGIIQSFLRQRREEEPARDGYNLLSEREQQVFRLVVEGFSTGKIGQMLGVSPKTVEKHRINIMRKLQVGYLLDLVRYAMRIGIIDPDCWTGGG